MARLQVITETVAIIPFFESFDLLNAWMAFSQGDKVGGTVSLVGLAPAIGSVTGAGKAVDAWRSYRSLKALGKASDGPADEAIEKAVKEYQEQALRSADEQAQALKYRPQTGSEKYAEVVNSNEPWSWKSDFGDGISTKQKRAYRQDALDQGLTPEVKLKSGTKFADFEAAGLVIKKDTLPEELWTKGDSAQFKWLDERFPGGRPEGTTWHHTEVPGEMQLVPFGPHNVTNHSGGRATGQWADSSR